MELIEKTSAAIERGRSNPWLGIGAIAAGLLLVAWIAWAIYVTSDNGANAGLGVVLSWPVLLGALALIASPFVGLYLLLRSEDEADDADSTSGDSAAEEDETEEKPTAESDEENSEDEEGEDDSEDENGDEDEAEEENEDGDEAQEQEEAEETDPDEEPPSGEKAQVSG